MCSTSSEMPIHSIVLLSNHKDLGSDLEISVRENLGSVTQDVLLRNGFKCISYFSHYYFYYRTSRLAELFYSANTMKAGKLFEKRVPIRKFICFKISSSIMFKSFIFKEVVVCGKCIIAQPMGLMSC